MSGFLFNPSAEDLWRSNAVISGRNRSHYLAPMAGTLSIKTVKSGEAAWTTPNGRYVVTPDTFLVLDEGQEYSLEIDSREQVETFCVFFRPRFLAESLSVGLGEGVEPSGVLERLDIADYSIVGALMQIQALVDSGPMASGIADDAFALLGLELIKRADAARWERSKLAYATHAVRDEVFRRLGNARDHALSNLHRAVELEEMAREASLSPFHFHRLHRQAFGETPHQFLTRARLARAARLLRLSTLDVESVAYEVGYSSAPSFIHLFKSRYGMTPAKFRG